MADHPTYSIKKIVTVIIVAFIVTFAAGYVIDISDETLSAAKNALNSGIEALISSLLFAAGMLGRNALTPK